MTVYAADFGAEATTIPGVTEYSSAGAVTVARTSAGVVAIGSGLFVRDFTPNASTAVLVWDADGIIASEVITASVGGGGGLDASGVRAAIGLTAANLDAQLSAIPTAQEVRAEMDTNSTKLDEAISTRLASAAYVAPDNPTISMIAGYLDTEIAAILAAVDTEVAAIKAKTDNLPVNTTTTLTTLTGLVDDLETRLTAVRAGLLDNLVNLDATVSSRLSAAGYSPSPTAAAIRAEIDANSLKLDATVSSRLASASYTPAPTSANNATAVRAELATELGRLDATVSSRLTLLQMEGSLVIAKEGSLATLLPAASYVAPDNAAIALIKTKTDNLPADPASNTQVNTRLAAADYIAPDNVTLTAINTRLPVVPASVSDVTVTVNGGFEAADRILLQNTEQSVNGARTLNLATGLETVSRTGRTDKTRTLYRDAAQTLPVTSPTDGVLGAGELV